MDYRPFRNSDVPALMRLWNGAGLGRGAAYLTGPEQLDMYVFAQPWFDRLGMILAVNEEGRVVGFVHAAMVPAEAEQANCEPSLATTGVICVLVVAPQFRHQGIGTELLLQAENYLKGCGATTIQAGGLETTAPFWLGLYGGAGNPGFLLSDPDAEPFFLIKGYVPGEQVDVLQRTAGTRDPVNVRLLTNRRTSQLVSLDNYVGESRWWISRWGRLDCAAVGLMTKSSQSLVAQAVVSGLDAYNEKWNSRAVAISDLIVAKDNRRKGYGQALLCEIARQLRTDAIDILEAHVPAADTAARCVFQASGFQQVDTGVTYVKALNHAG